ncbi:MAG: hypothetical protein ACKVRN_13760 [Pyrinomonadaceae bacterium]
MPPNGGIASTEKWSVTGEAQLHHSSGGQAAKNVRSQHSTDLYAALIPY